MEGVGTRSVAVVPQECDVFRYDVEFRVLHVAPIGKEWDQGLSYSIPGLMRAQLSCGAEVGLISTHPGSRYLRREEFEVDYFRDDNVDSFADKVKNRSWDLVVFHSTYIPWQAKFARALSVRGIPYIITPRSGMTREALARRRIKKLFGNILFFRGMVERACGLHFLSEPEARASSFWRKPFFVAGNGIELPEVGDDGLDRRGRSNRLRLVFIGRIEPYQKGLDRLIKGVKSWVGRGDGDAISIGLYGPETGESERLRRLVASEGLESIIRFEGPVYEEKKASVLRGADAFVLTSRFEGLPMAVLEALAYGVPCLLTPGTNIADEVVDGGAGWLVEGTAESIGRGIYRVLAERQRLPTMARNARRLAEERFSWPSAAEGTLKGYRRLAFGEG